MDPVGALSNSTASTSDSPLTMELPSQFRSMSFEEQLQHVFAGRYQDPEGATAEPRPH